MIPLDFVAGTHGHFLEYVLNRGFGFAPADFLPFTALGSSHQMPMHYKKNRKIVCGHWFETDPKVVTTSRHVIRIVFDKDDLLLVSSLSLLRAADQNIHNDQLDQDTRSKLDNAYYQQMLIDIYRAYPFLDRSDTNIPRYVLREYFKFGFANPEINGYWKKLQSMLSLSAVQEFRVELKCFYDVDRLINTCIKMSAWLGLPFEYQSWLPDVHAMFKAKVKFLEDKRYCDLIIDDIMHQRSRSLPNLNLLQESYINGNLERLLGKEMPFHQDQYFTHTRDMLQYIHTQAPCL